MKALIIGRFQPLHLGHVDLIEKTSSLGFDEIIIGVGSNGFKITEKYPFTFDEVKGMLKDTLKISVRIFEIPDIEDDRDYAEHVERITGCNSNDTKLVSGNAHTIECFTKYSRQYPVIKPGLDFPLQHEKLSATLIRSYMNDGGYWYNYVPKPVYEKLKRLHGVARIKESYYAKAN